jgi:hypothetical protein
MRVDRHAPRNLARDMSAAQKSYLVEILLPKEQVTASLSDKNGSRIC